MKDRPAEIVFYEWGISRWLTSRTRMALDCAGRSIYRELLDLCYAQGSIPNDPPTLMRHCGATQAEWDRSWPTISRHFHQGKHDPEALCNDQADVFRKNYFRFRAEQRERGKKGGRPKSISVRDIKSGGLSSGKASGLKMQNPDKSQDETRQDETRQDKHNNGSVPAVTKQRFQEWLRPWPRVPNEERTLHMFVFCWTPENDANMFACRDRYLRSDEVGRGIVMNPDNFLSEQKENNWNGKWQTSAKSEPVRLMYSDKPGYAK